MDTSQPGEEQTQSGGSNQVDKEENNDNKATKSSLYPREEEFYGFCPVQFVDESKFMTRYVPHVVVYSWID